MTFKVKDFSVALVVLVINLMPMAAVAKGNSADTYNWDRVMDAIIQVESEGNPNARSGNCCGAMQIKPILVKDCNDILERRNEKKRFTMSDRFSVEKSREMFVIIQSHYNPTNNLEKAIRMWNGGVNYNVKSTQRYYQKVMAAMKK